MSVLVNGKPFVLSGTPATLEKLLSSLPLQRPFAVACNQEFVPSSAYAERELKDGDRIDIVHPSAGG